MGILASSPELMLAAQRGATQPLKMNQGGSVGQYMQTIQQLKQAGDKSTLNNIATDQRLPRSIQMAAANALAGIGAQASQPSQPSQQVPLAATDKLGSLASGTPVMAVRGSGDEVPVTVGVNPENLLTDATGPKPIGQSEGGRQRSAALADAPGKIASGLSQGLGTIFDLPEATGPAPSPESPMGTKNKQLVRSRAAAAMGIQDDPALRPIVEQNIDESISQSLRNRPDPALGDEFGNIAPDGSMPSEILAATTSPPSEPQTGDDQTTGDGDKPDTTSATTQNAITKLQQNLTNLQTGSGKTSKLSPDQATNQSVLDDFSYETAQFISPEEVDLNKVDQAAKDLMGFDPKAAGEKKETAFWMGLMKAGLAMAAGESENAITNIAKGLSYGLDSYGKDIALLNEQEREDRKEFRQLKVQMIKDERSFNIAQAGAMNTHNQHIADAKNRFTANQATLGLQEAQNIRDADYKQANLALANAQLQNTIVKDIANLQIKGEELQLSRDTLQATIEKAQPQSLRIFKEVGYVDADGNVTQKGIDAYGSEAALVKAAVTGSSSASRETEGDRDAAALSRAITAKLADQPISTEDLARLPKEFREDMTLFDDFIKQSGLTSTGSIPTYTEMPSQDELAKLAAAGTTKVKIGTQIFDLTPKK